MLVQVRGEDGRHAEERILRRNGRGRRSRELEMQDKPTNTESRAPAAHISVRLVCGVVGVRVPKAAASHAHALALHLANDHLHDVLVPRQLKLLLYAALDTVGDLTGPLR